MALIEVPLAVKKTLISLRNMTLNFNICLFVWSKINSFSLEEKNDKRNGGYFIIGHSEYEMTECGAPCEFYPGLRWNYDGFRIAVSFPNLITARAV